MSSLQRIRCKTCGVVKSSADFYENSTKLGRFRECVPCHNKRSSQFRKDNPDYDLKRRYDMTADDFKRMLEEQGGTCANDACDYGSDEDHELVVDHCHETGKVRGLLCNWCNLAEGQLKSSTKVAEGLIIYMRKHNGEEEEG